MKEYYKLRTCYLNFAEHLQNAWNVNFMYYDAPGIWKESDWTSFVKQIKAFGFNNLMFWIPPSLCKVCEEREIAAEMLNVVIEVCHREGISVNPMLAVNTIGAEWYFACPNDPADRVKIMEYWEFYADNLKIRIFSQ